MFDDIAKRVIEAPADNCIQMLKGATGSGKSTVLLERYKYMVEKLGIPSEKILILLLNRTQSLEWRSKTVLKSSGAIWRTSYYGFIQAEIKTYYPTILKKCSEIIRKEIKPIFLTFESAQFLVAKAIEGRREEKGVFAGVTSYTDRIAIDLTANLVKAATSDIPYYEIGDRLYNALETKDDSKKQVFREVDDIISAYRKKCMTLGILDFGMAVDLYNNYLLKDENYKQQLFSRVQHIIVDNIEECVPTEIDFIRLMMPNVKTCLMGYNPEGGYGEIFGSNHNYMRLVFKDIITKRHNDDIDTEANTSDNENNNCETVELAKTFTCSKEMCKFSDLLFDSIQGNGSVSMHNISDGEQEIPTSTFIQREPLTELRSEMLDEVGKKVCQLISEEGYKPSDIVILSTYADPVTEFVVERILERQGYKLKNLARKSKVVENPFSQALITLAQLCHPDYSVLPNRDDVKALIKMLLKIDSVRSSILAGEVCSQRPFAQFPDVQFPGLVERIGYYNVEKYQYIRDWIDQYKKSEKPLPIDEFFQRVFLEVLISKDISDTDINQAKNLIDSARTFVDIVSRFKNMNASKGFLDMIRGGIKASESIFELEDNLEGDYVLMSTPIAYLASNIRNKITILTGLNSKNWTPRNIKELTNVRVLTKTWDKNAVYTEDIEEVNQKEYLAILMRAILKRCGERIITFESILSANGYENDGELGDYFDEIM